MKDHSQGVRSFIGKNKPAVGEQIWLEVRLSLMGSLDMEKWSMCHRRCIVNVTICSGRPVVSWMMIDKGTTMDHTAKGIVLTGQFSMDPSRRDDLNGGVLP